MKIHILGICGTFMGGVALLARELGFQVSGSDVNVYPPMSTQLQDHGITLFNSYDPQHLKQEYDLIVIGNALSRGNPAVEYVLSQGLPYLSGPEFLSRYVLKDRWVLAVAGTHGKTTVASMLAWMLESTGLAPGFLIGGVPIDFDQSARLGDAPFFVVEADEYDTAFFDKRSKFIHYHPRTLIINNIEFDHADIFPDLDAIKRQFHHLVRTVPGNGLIITPNVDDNIADVIELGCWTAVEQFSADTQSLDSPQWRANLITLDAKQFDVYCGDECVGQVSWSYIGRHNVLNALAALAAARHAGVIPAQAVKALANFGGVKRRMEKRASINGINIYDDFAHHPTAIATTLEGFRNSVGNERIIVILEPRSNTMRMGVHQQALAPALALADEAILFQPPDLDWQLDNVAKDIGPTSYVFNDTDDIIKHIVKYTHSGDHVIIMSNGAFGDIHNKLIEALA